MWKDNDGWSMSAERAFIEDLLNKRFNLFLVVVGAVIAGSANAKSQWALECVLWPGAALATMLAIPLRRSQQKLDLILKELEKRSDHPTVVIDNLANDADSYSNNPLPGSKRGMIGYTIPFYCCAYLWVAAMFSRFGCFHVPPN